MIATPVHEITDMAANTAAALKPALAAELEERRVALPMLPEAAFAALQLLSSPDPDFRTLSSLVHRDAALATGLIRAANSPAYYVGRKIVSIQQAIVRLGGRAVGEIVLAMAIEGKNARVPGFEPEMRALHEHGIITAVMAQEVARIRRGNVEEAFLGGLVHDLGRSVLIETVQKLCIRQRLPVDHGAVRLVADEFHQRVGAMVGSSWSLPEPVVAAMGGHHQPKSLDEGGLELPHLIALADMLAHRYRRHGEPDLAHPSMVALHIYAEDLQTLFAARERLDARIGAFR